MKKIVLSHSLLDEGMKRLEDNFDAVKVIGSGEPADMLKELMDADGVIIRVGRLDKDTLLKCKNLKVIGRPGVGVDCVDVDTATKLGIPVVITPGANSRSVAEHAMAFMFAVSKGLVQTDKETKKGNYNYRYENKSYELKNKNVFVIGFGNIGREFAQMCSGIGMNVTVYDPFVTKEAVEKFGFKYEEKIENGLSNTHVLSVHIPLTNDTKGLIGKKQLKMLNKNSIIINCSRGGIIEEAALKAALDNEEIFGAGLDVFVNEPIGADYPMLQAKNIVTTPHNAAITKEASMAMAFNCIDGVIEIVNGHKWDHVANKEAYNHLKWK